MITLDLSWFNARSLDMLYWAVWDLQERMSPERKAVCEAIEAELARRGVRS